MQPIATVGNKTLCFASKRTNSAECEAFNVANFTAQFFVKGKPLKIKLQSS